MLNNCVYNSRTYPKLPGPHRDTEPAPQVINALPLDGTRFDGMF